MDKEKFGALSDAVFAIAMTLLVLELPIPESEQELHEMVRTIAISIADFGLSFAILFAFWYNQRRINDLFAKHTRITLALHCFTLMMICLLPFSANLVYQFGGNVTSQMHFTHAVFVDLFFIAICLLADLSIHISLAIAGRAGLHHEHERKKVQEIWRSRQIATFILAAALLLAFALPGPNRWSLVAIPLLFLFEDTIVRQCSRLLNRQKAEG